MFLSSEWIELGVEHRITFLYTSNQNGLVKSKLRMVVKCVLTLLLQSAVPIKSWNYAFRTIVYLHNRLPTPVL